MEDTQPTSSTVDAAIESLAEIGIRQPPPEASASPTVASEPTYTAHETDITPDSGRTTTTIYAAVLSQPEYVLGLLADRGFIPAELAPRPNMVSPDDPWIQDLSPELQEIALTLTPEQWDEIAVMDPTVRDQLLGRAGDLQRY